MRIRRAALTAGPLLAATVLLTAVPASAAGTRWASCSRGKCDWGYVDGRFATIWDQSNDGIGAALDVRTYEDDQPRWIKAFYGEGIKEQWFAYPVRKARICNYDGRDISSCGGWKTF